MTDSPPILPDNFATFTSGGQIPLLGFGTWQIQGQDAVEATAVALESGYRHIDTAAAYDNEAEVGRGLQASGVAREDVFLTTKFPPELAGEELDTLRRSLDLLATDYVDLWLVHWPGERGRHLDMWRAFIDAKEAGLVREIGVSNFGIDLIDEITSATGASPAVNQIEWSPLLFDPSLLEEHRTRGIALEGYSALRGGSLENPTIVRIAEITGRTPAQIIIRWHLQHEVIVIPKSRNADRIRTNAAVGDFTLSAQDMAAIDSLGGN